MIINDNHTLIITPIFLSTNLSLTLQQSVKSKLETRPFSFQVSKRSTLQPWNRLYSSHRRRRSLPGDPARTRSWRTMLRVESTKKVLRKYRKYRLHQSDKIWAYCQGMLCEAQFYSTSLALSAFGVSFPVFLQLFWPKVQRWLRPPDFATVGVSLQTPPSPTIACLQLNCGEIKLSMFQSPNVYADCECLKNHQDMHSRYAFKICMQICVCVPCACPQIYRLFKWCAGMYENCVHTHTACCMSTCLFCKGAT